MTSQSFSIWTICFGLLLFANPVFSDVPIESKMVHVRMEGPREWSTFDDEPEAHRIDRTFDAQHNSAACVLRLRHQDVKQTWSIELNGKSIGRLKSDENDMVEYFIVPSEVLVDGRNVLTIEQESQRSQIPDDILIGEITLCERTLEEELNQARILVVVKNEAGESLPARITITNAEGALQTVHVESVNHLAVRPGIVYTSTGQAEIGVPAGDYAITVGRGFEYSIATTGVRLAKGEKVARELIIRREVNTEGYVACDTHVHTLTHSGHGDATVGERMVTLACEGIELPIATDHNVQIDHRPFAKEMQVGKYFTPVIGNEVTTHVGHFNIWPIASGARIPNHRSDNWNSIFDEIYGTPGTRIAILNHARDLHGGTIPFGPKMHNALAGENLDRWPIRFNAIEVINSGAIQSDALQLCRDWMALLNAGHNVTPVGCSDSHDVGVHFVGQARTYIRCDDRDPSHIDIDLAAESFIRGEVLVSYGLLCDLTVEGKHRSGAFAQPSSDTLNVSVHVSSPTWTTATRVQLFANGVEVRSQAIDTTESNAGGVGRQTVISWVLELPTHDIHLVAVASGPGIDGLHWRTAKPYQPTSPVWTPQTLGISGPIWIDADRDGHRRSACDYARDIVAKSNGDLRTCLNALKLYDEAVAIQVAHQLELIGLSVLSEATTLEIFHAARHVQSGFAKYQSQRRENIIARTTK